MPPVRPATIQMQYRRSGRSGLQLPAISLGLWQNFGGNRDHDTAAEILGYAFDAGVTHFDLANNYGPPPGSAEELFGTILAREFRPYRDEMIISTKAGYRMWPGPYGEFGSRKYLMASLDQSLSRMGLDYVDIFYSHRYDPNTPLEETMGALADIVRSGKAIYVGISSYPEAETRAAHKSALEGDRRSPAPSTSRPIPWSTAGSRTTETIDACGELGIGVIAFSPLTQGVLSGKYNKGAKEGTRAENARADRCATAMSRPTCSTLSKSSCPSPKLVGQSMVQLALVLGAAGVPK